MTSQGTAHGRFERAVNRGHVQAAEMAAREMGGLSLADALSLCELLALVDPTRYERAALRWLQRFIDERLPVGCVNRPSRCRGIFVDESAEAIASVDVIRWV